MEHVAGAYRPEVLSAERDNRYRRALSGYELDLESILSMAMHNRSHVAFLETKVLERPAKYNRVMWLHRCPAFHGYAVTNTGMSWPATIHTVASSST